MGLATALLGGATLASGFLQKKASDKATDAQTKASEQALAMQQAAIDRMWAGQQGFIDYGMGAGGLGGLNTLNGGNLDGFWNSPDVQAGMKAAGYSLDHGAAARGRVFSGGYMKDRDEALMDKAAGYLGNYRNSLMWGANLGQSAASGTAQNALQGANSMAGTLGGIGNAQASGALTNANIYGNTLGGLAGIFGGMQNKTASSYATNPVQLPPNPSMPNMQYQY